MPDDWSVPGYRTVRELARHDSSGRSVLALHEASGLPVTIRYHGPQLAPSQCERLRATNRVLADLGSAHVARLYEHIEIAAGADAGSVAAATVREYVDGASVQWLARRPLRPVSALALLRAGLLALSDAHAAGLTHGGYKAENLLVDRSGAARLADFGAGESSAGATDTDGPAATDTDGPAATDADGPAATGADPDPPSAEDAAVRPAEDAAGRDVQAAFAVFVACVKTRRNGRLPRRLRALAGPAAAGDRAALLAAVEDAGRAGWGDNWCSRAQRDLARRVAKVPKWAPRRRRER